MVQSRHPAGGSAVTAGENYRITVLTDALLRLEYSADGIFTDAATQVVVNRLFPKVPYEVFRSGKELLIRTDSLELFYDEKPFSRGGLRIRVRAFCGSTWYFGDEPDSLPGTARTLDATDGDRLVRHWTAETQPLRMGSSIMNARQGFAVLDDSTSLLVGEDDSLTPHPAGYDLYFFGYGHDYARCLRDYYALTGRTPLLPRFALGNWWSRYHRYTQQEYEDLILRFEREEIPFTVAVIDMDWHITRIDPKYGDGWTGYTWNEELFPDHRSFLAWLHAHGLKTALNIHPADGVRASEAMYPAVAAQMGVDAEREEPVPFDIADPAYRKASFDHIFHPYEAEGVDFWWLDWQQGGVTKVPGLDPLWMLNHVHYRDSARGSRRGLTFSRYAGPGSHRYPVGFSGDTIVSWNSLRFQPEFTASASNIGYGWWSHDIGGHMMGYRDEELTVRWMQYGVFSPILRLHTTDSPYMHKEPWFFSLTAQAVMKRFLRLRHALIPYLYTMNATASRDGVPLVRPLYWLCPDDEDAYGYPNEYLFGSQLLVLPVTSPAAEDGFAAETGLIPEGVWYDVFTGHRYAGRKKITFSRALDSIPVLAKAGAVIPLSSHTDRTALNSIDNPAAVTLCVFPGQDGEFVLEEDDGCGSFYEEGNWCRTRFRWTQEDGAGVLTIGPAEGCTGVIPDTREWTVRIYGTGADTAAGTADLPISKAAESRDPDRQILTLTLRAVPVSETVRIPVTGLDIPEEEEMDLIRRRLDEILMAAEMDNLAKIRFGALLEKKPDRRTILAEIRAVQLPENVKHAMEELLL